MLCGLNHTALPGMSGYIRPSPENRSSALGSWDKFTSFSPFFTSSAESEAQTPQSPESRPVTNSGSVSFMDCRWSKVWLQACSEVRKRVASGGVVLLSCLSTVSCRFPGGKPPHKVRPAEEQVALLCFSFSLGLFFD